MITKEWGVQNLMGEADRLETKGRVAVRVQMQSAGGISSCSLEVSLCPIRAFKKLDQVHPQYRRQCDLLKVH